MATKVMERQATNDAAPDIAFQQSYSALIRLRGTADLLFHRWSNEAVAEKAAAAKNSASKKTDNLESYIWRCDNGNLGLPAEYLRMSVVMAAKFRQDPRSPRKSAMDLYKAGVVALTQLGDLGVSDWDYEDRRRAMIQRQGITRTRPALKAGWTVELELAVLTPEYIAPDQLHEVINQAGRLVGVGDFRPTFGRFLVEHFEVLTN